MNRVYRSYKDHNRWMCVAPERKLVTLADVVDWIAIVLGFTAAIFGGALLILMPLI